jgi:hypothetical protein
VTTMWRNIGAKHAPPQGHAQQPALPQASRVAVGIGLVLVTLSALSLFMRTNVDKRGEGVTTTRETAQVGVACPHLRNAYLRYRKGDEEGFRRSVKDAAEAAEQALDNSGEIFGPPERVGWMLHSTLESEGIESPAIQNWLRRSEDACERLGLWRR